MRRLTALLGKELRQHAAIGLALFACLGLAYALLLLGMMLGNETVSLMQAHASFLFFLALAGAVLGNRLVVGEYYGRTQLFVEALPLARWEMVALKYLLGLAVLLLAAGLSLATTAMAALSREAIDVRFLAIVAARSASFVCFVWSFFFAMGFIGRFRVAIYIAILLALGVVDQMTELELQHFGPLAVLDNNTLPFEREVMPATAVAQTLALGAGLSALAFLLALINEGSVAEALARRMSLREKAVIGVLFVALTLAFAYLDERRDKEPYTFPEDEVVRSKALPLEVLYLLPERRSDAATLLRRLEADLGALTRLLEWLDPPAARVAYSSSLDAGIYDLAELAENDGILVRANFAPEAGFDPRDFSAHLAGLMLDEATEGRARFEPKAWLRDAFAHWWSLRGRAGDADSIAGLETLCQDGFTPLLRALWAARAAPPSEDRLAAWLRYPERHGEDLAEALAMSGLLVLEEKHGRAAVLSLAREIFARQPAQDLRELIYEWRHPMAAVFERATALAWPDFIAEWRAELERLGAAPACRLALAGVFEGSAWLEVEAGAGALRDVVYGFRFVQPPPAGTLVTLLHGRLTPFDETLERRDLRREEKLWPAAEHEASWRLPGFYSQRSRAFLALEVESVVLGCPVRLHAERRVLE